MIFTEKTSTASSATMSSFYATVFGWGSQNQSVTTSFKDSKPFICQMWGIQSDYKLQDDQDNQVRHNKNSMDGRIEGLFLHTPPHHPHITFHRHYVMFNKNTFENIEHFLPVMSKKKFHPSLLRCSRFYWTGFQFGILVFIYITLQRTKHMASSG